MLTCFVVPEIPPFGAEFFCASDGLLLQVRIHFVEFGRALHSQLAIDPAK